MSTSLTTTSTLYTTLLRSWISRMMECVFNKLGVEHAIQPWHKAKAEVLDKRHQLHERFNQQTVLHIPLPFEVPEKWFIKVDSPHGKIEVEVFAFQYNKLNTGDTVNVAYRLSRRIGTEHVQGKLIK